MCIIICANKLSIMKEEVPLDWLKQSWENNTDGAGYSFIETEDDGKKRLTILKGFFEFDRFLESYLMNRELNKSSRFMIHMRNNTTGDNTQANCHPFVVNKYTVMAHNGTINKTDAKKTGPSDSYLLADMLSKLNNNFAKNTEYQYLIEKYIGAINKVAFHLVDDTMIFLNEDKWILEKDNNIILSNDYYKTKRRTYVQVWTPEEENVYPFFVSNCSECKNHIIGGNRKEFGNVFLCHDCYNKKKKAKTELTEIVLSIRDLTSDQNQYSSFCSECGSTKPTLKLATIRRTIKDGSNMSMTTITQPMCDECVNKLPKEDINRPKIMHRCEVCHEFHYDCLHQPYRENGIEKWGNICPNCATTLAEKEDDEVNVCYNCETPLVTNTEHINGYCTACNAKYFSNVGCKTKQDKCVECDEELSEVEILGGLGVCSKCWNEAIKVEKK